MEETLTADTTGIADEDGLTNVSYSYQWIRSNGTTDTDLAGEESSTYTLVAADEGKTIKVKVSFADDANNLETLTSGATAAVAARLNSPATGAPAISGTAQVGETLTASTSDFADQDGLDNATFSYQWLADDSAIPDATGSTYTLVPADQGKTIKVKVSFTDDANNLETLTSAATGCGGCQAQHCAHGPAHHQREGPGGRDADGFHLEHRGPGWVGQCHLQLSVAGGRLGHYRRDRFDLHPCACRRGQEHQGQGVLCRRRE